MRVARVLGSPPARAPARLPWDLRTGPADIANNVTEDAELFVVGIGHHDSVDVARTAEFLQPTDLGPQHVAGLSDSIAERCKVQPPTARASAPRIALFGRPANRSERTRR